MARSTDEKVLLGTPSLMSKDINNQFTLMSIDIICSDHTLQILCKSLLCFAKIGRLTTEKSPKLAS